MGNTKLQMRDRTLDKKRQFIETDDHLYAIESATLKGIYYGLGGTKMIPLPHYCSVITNSVSVLTKARAKFTGDISKDINKFIRYVSNNIDNIVDIQYGVNEQTPEFLIYFDDCNEATKINIDLPLTSTNIADIVKIILINTDNIHIFNSVELDLITNIIKDEYSIIDKDGEK